MRRIILITAGPPQRKLVLESLPAMIGRDATADICLEDSWVGCYQCILDQDGDSLQVLDLGSRTGTFVNGKRIQRTLLRHGDTLTIGRSDFFVQVEDDPRNAAPDDGRFSACCR
jgi:pSer/pThr/pTyr-binding forkhead associated (FHA) protein